MTFDIQEILGLLPTATVLLIDRVVEFERGKRLVAIKNVTFNEPFFQALSRLSDHAACCD